MRHANFVSFTDLTQHSYFAIRNPQFFSARAQARAQSIETSTLPSLALSSSTLPSSPVQTSPATSSPQFLTAREDVSTLRCHDRCCTPYNESTNLVQDKLLPLR